MNIQKMMAELKAQGKTDEEVAVAIAKAYDSEVQRIKAEEENKRRERMLQEKRKAIRQAIFKDTGLVKAQQIAYLYAYAEKHAEEIREGILPMINTARQ